MFETTASRNVSRSLIECVVAVADVNARTQPSEFVDASDVPRRSSRRHMVAIYNYDARPTPNDRQGEVVYVFMHEVRGRIYRQSIHEDG